MAININHQIDQVNNFKITAVGSGATVGAAGIVTYHGDGSQLTGISGGGGGGCLKLVETTNFISDGVCAGCNITGDGENNILLGQCAGKNVSTGDDNIVIGNCVGMGITTASDSIVIGNKAMGNASKSQGSNILIGKETGYNYTYNTHIAIGNKASYLSLIHI